MRSIELRHRLTALLLQAERPLPLADLAQSVCAAEPPEGEAADQPQAGCAQGPAAAPPAPQECAAPTARGPGNLQERIASTLAALVAEGLVVLLPPYGAADTARYRWAAHWQAEQAPGTSAVLQGFLAQQAAWEPRYGSGFSITDPPPAAFHEFLVGPYRPPAAQRWLVLAQCSVRRPFSSSPSHAALRRAVALATGMDPRLDRTTGPVHMAVLASRLGPVPYELEDVYPASVRSTGVKGFDDATYARCRPVLTARLAQYLQAHAAHYAHVAAFGEGRYAQIMRDAAQQAGTPFPVLPQCGGLRVTRYGRFPPRPYWERYWIQLFVTLTDWLDEPGRQSAAQRLRALDLEYA